MDLDSAAELMKLIQTMGPGLALGVLGLWFGFKKDVQCREKDTQMLVLMERLAGISEKNTISNIQVVSSIDALREVIRLGTRQ